MATTWDNGSTEYTLPNPDKTGEGADLEYHGAAGRTLGAKLRVDSRAPQTARIPMSWSMATIEERADIKTAYDACAHLPSTLALDDGDTFTVLAFHNGMTVKKWYSWDDTPYYRIEIIFDEEG